MKRALPGLLLVLLFACTRPAPDAELLPQENAAGAVTFGSTGEDRDPEIDPEGRWMYFATSAYASHFDIYRKKPDASLVTRVTSSASDERFPKVNPVRPEMLAFSSNVNGEWDIFVIRDVEKNPSRWERVSEEGSQDIHPSWSPDGTMIVYSSGPGDATDGWLLKIVDLKSGTVHVLPQVDGLLPEWSPLPGDDRIVFQRMRHRDNWFSSIWTIRFREGNVTEMTAVFGEGRWAAINPTWSPDGRHILFASVAKSRIRAETLDEADDLWIITADGGRPMQMTTDPAAEWMPTWGRNGKIYFLSRRGGSARVWCMDEPKIE